mgnify:CR=1 FL=1|tara:strand:- start:108 stop:3497 length:3390 start_codon:yes stop_codon:yes gene_type:complete
MFKKLTKAFLFATFALSLTKAQDVLIAVGDTSFAGYTDNIVVPITISNPNGNVGGVQFDVSVSPEMVILSGVSTIGVADEFSADYNMLSDGSSRVVFYNAGDPNGLNAGTGSRVINLHFGGTDVLSAILEIKLNNVVVSDASGNLLSSASISGNLTIGDVIYLSGSTGTADVEETVEIDFNLVNTGSVGGIQFDVKDSPNYLNLVSVAATDRTAGFSVDFNDVNEGANSRIILYSPDDINLEPGSGSVVTATFEVINTAYADSVYLFMENIMVTDGIGGSYWIASADSGTVVVYPGYIEEPSNLQAVDGQDAYVTLTWDPPSGPVPDNISEDFEDGVPENWIFSSNNSVGWFLTGDCTSEWWPGNNQAIPSHTNYMCSNDDIQDPEGPDSDASADYMITPMLNVSGAANVFLNFESYFTGQYSHIASIGVSEDGVNFTEVYSLSPALEWVNETVDLSPFINGDALYILFHSDDAGTWASGWAVDDISIDFLVRENNRTVQFNLTEQGEWVIAASREELSDRYPGPIQYRDLVDINNPLLNNNDRPVSIDAYKVYKSTNAIDDFEEIVEVEGSVTSYTDENVVNNTSYYYYVTAIYPDGSESVPTNIVSATPVEWVEISISDGASLTGQTDTIEISVNNESLLGGLFFEIEDFPDVLVGENVLTTDRTTGWSLSILDDNGKISIAGFGPLAGADPLQPGNGPVCRVVVRPQGDQALTVSLTMTDVQIQDISSPPVQLNWTAEIGSYDVGIETQYVMLVDGHGEPGSQMTSPLCLINTQAVYGIQIDFVIDPPFIFGSGINVTDLVDFSTWSVSSQQLGNVFTLLLFDNTLSNPIMPGSWYLGELLLDVLPGSPEEFMVDIEYGEMIISDAYNQQLVSAGLPSEVYIGAPPASYSIQNVEGLLTPGGQGSFEVHLTNTEIVGTMSFEIEDLPNYLTVTSVEAVGRFENGIIDGSTGENLDEGYFYFLGYDFTGGIPVGDGPVIKINVQMGQNIQNPNVQLLFHEVSAGDAGANSITAISQGLGLFADVNLSSTTEAYVPAKFELHDNFPNPFNPSTIISYDLAVDGYVDLSVYNVVGKKVKTIVNQNETAGRKITAWYGTDDSGNTLSAGMYFYRLTAGGKVFTKKMVLMK